VCFICVSEIREDPFETKAAAAIVMEKMARGLISKLHCGNIIVILQPFEYLTSTLNQTVNVQFRT
jgi:hypothetical protein